MNEVAGIDGETYWAFAPAETLRRTVDLARRVMQAPIAVIASCPGGAARILAFAGGANAADFAPVIEACHARVAAGPPCVMAQWPPDEPQPTDGAPRIGAVVAAPIRLEGRRDIGLLCVMDFVAREWSAEPLADLTALLVSRIEPTQDVRHNQHVEPAAPARLSTEVSDQIRAQVDTIARLGQFLETERRPDVVAVHARSLRAATDSLRALVERMPGTGDDAHPADLPESDAAHREGPLPIRILLADDLDLNRKLIADMLSIEGHVVDCVADGAAAVQAASQRPYDLILMDMIMPNMDGIAATRAIRALPGPAAKVPIVALTANSFQEQLDSCLKAGMDATLTKPMSLDALASAVLTWTHGRHEAA